MSTGTGFSRSKRPSNSSRRLSHGWPSFSWALDYSCGHLSMATGSGAPWSRQARRCAHWAISFHARAGTAALDPVIALAGLGTVALQIGYLPTLYAAFNRREALITMLDSRAGVPSWGPELLARTHYGLGSGVSAVSELPELFESWEQWSADVSESHTTYVPLIWFRSPHPLSSWVTAQLAVLDAAALYLALLPKVRVSSKHGSVCGGASRASATSPERYRIPIPENADPSDGHLALL